MRGELIDYVMNEYEMNTLPVPWQWEQTSVLILPVPWQRGQGDMDIMIPRFCYS